MSTNRKAPASNKKSQPSTSPKPLNNGVPGVKQTLQQCWDKYKEIEEDVEVIGPTGMEQFCKDFDIDPEDPLMLTLAWYWGARTMGYFDKSEFINGMKKLGWVDNDPYIFGKLKTKLVGISTQTQKNNEQFKDLYSFAFGFCKETDQAKVIDKDLGAEMLKLVLGTNRPHVTKFSEFLTKTTEYKSINNDQWVCFLAFSKEVKENLDNYDESSSWPCLYDDYVSFVKGGDD